MRLDRQVEQARVDTFILKLLSDGKERYLQEFAEAMGRGGIGRHTGIKSRLSRLLRDGKLVSREVSAAECHADNGQPRLYFKAAS
jgi:hypothetical protein